MRRRPWPIVILAFLHVFGPFGNLLLSAWVAKMHPEAYLSALLAISSTWDLIDFFVLLPIGGVAIYLCKKWSYPIFLLIAGLTVYSNYSTWVQAPHQFPAWILVLTLALDAAFVAYFLLPAVRTVYMDPRIRWWESKPRYLANLPGTVTDAHGVKNGTISDISEGGIFFMASDELSPEKPVQVHFSHGDSQLKIPGKIVYRRQGAHAGYGVQFVHTRKSSRGLHKVIGSLRKSGARARDNIDWKQDLITWFSTLATTGKGLVPAPDRPKARQGGSPNVQTL